MESSPSSSPCKRTAESTCESNSKRVAPPTEEAIVDRCRSCDGRESLCAVEVTTADRTYYDVLLCGLCRDLGRKGPFYVLNAFDEHDMPVLETTPPDDPEELGVFWTSAELRRRSHCAVCSSVRGVFTADVCREDYRGNNTATTRSVSLCWRCGQCSNCADELRDGVCIDGKLEDNTFYCVQHGAYCSHCKTYHDCDEEMQAAGDGENSICRYQCCRCQKRGSWAEFAKRGRWYCLSCVFKDKRYESDDYTACDSDWEEFRKTAMKNSKQESEVAREE